MCQASGGITLLVQILKHTPPWVFGLLLGLAYLGYLQGRTRVVSRRRMAVLPIAMLCLSFVGAWSSFGTHLPALVSWTCALLFVVASGHVVGPPSNVSYSPESKLFTVPGSWIPLALMLCIFFTKYAVAVIRAVDPAASDSVTLAAFTCTVYGLCSGAFLARALRIARVARRPQAMKAIGAEA